MSALIEGPIENPITRTAKTAVVPIRCLIVDDHAAVRVGLSQLLGADPRFEVVDAVASAEDAVGVAERVKLDVAIVDYHLGGRTGLWASRKLKRLPDPPAVLIYSAYSDGALAAACVAAEADGLLSKSRVDLDLCDAVCALASGRTCLPALSSSLAESMRQRLGPQEQAIFGMLAAGIPVGQIATTLGISHGVLESKLWHMLRDLELLDITR